MLRKSHNYKLSCNYSFQLTTASKLKLKFVKSNGNLKRLSFCENLSYSDKIIFLSLMIQTYFIDIQDYILNMKNGNSFINCQFLISIKEFNPYSA